MKIIECYEVVTSSEDPLSFKTFGYFKNREDGIKASKGQGWYAQDGSTSDKPTELVQFDSVEEFEFYAQIKKLKNASGTEELPTEMQKQLETFLSNPTILKQNNKHNSFIQGWEIKIPYNWHSSKIFGFFTNPEDGIKVSKGKGYYGGHGSVFGDKPREIVVFENLDEFNKSKDERNNEIKNMSYSEWKNFYYNKEINYVGLSEIEPDKTPDSTEAENFSM